MRPDGPLDYDAAVRLVREWYAADCRRGETEAERLAVRYPADPAGCAAWVRQFIELADGTGISAGRCGPRERSMYWDVLWTARIIAYRIGDPLPPEFAAWIRDVRSGRRQRPSAGGGRPSRLWRDARLNVYANRLEAAGYRRTRNDQSSAHRLDRPARSAADVITAALAPDGPKYSTVADVLTGAAGRQAMRRLLSRSCS